MQRNAVYCGVLADSLDNDYNMSWNQELSTEFLLIWVGSLWCQNNTATITPREEKINFNTAHDIFNII